MTTKTNADDKPKRDSWATPWSVITAVYNRFPVEIVIDVCADKYNKKCAIYLSEEEDALTCSDWIHLGAQQKHKGRIPVAWCNPPYSKPLPWVERCIEQYEKTGFNTLMLLKMDASTKWFTKLVEQQDTIIHVMSPRIQHDKPRGVTRGTSNEFCSCLAWIGGATMFSEWVPFSEEEAKLQYWNWKADA